MTAPEPEQHNALVRAQNAANLCALLGYGSIFAFAAIHRLPGGTVLLGILGCVGFAAGVVARIRRRAVKHGVIHFLGWGMFINVIVIVNAVLVATGLLRI